MGAIPTHIPTHILYLHGFRSSPLSTKAQMVGRWLAEHRPEIHFWCPQLPPSPREAMQRVFEGIAGWPHGTMAVMGSSLGGFYAGVVAERIGCPAVVLNPAVDPARDLAHHIGAQTTWQKPEEHFYFRAEYVDELRAMTPPALTRPERYAAVIAKGDELLDWREMTTRHAGAHTLLLEDSDHALSDFDQQLPFVLRFLHLIP
ncbi:MAG TPA: YqiA/YcfP family alpha/beta fold hydrolase [Ideonella sp.]|uniref:YqiA/YcfP family alpha/beta fold hydrolase n=1 Tax=Ideonella sp. TaxID=1929293 RepID=UPI002E2F520D|nr:YqiA/YcfP family alpha/beta fold hydrolase [Ideonella sp.]HEX5686650.1 YqiA/YcfP family alpha/beta fold hydrolase [Ideonella sp.]